MNTAPSDSNVICSYSMWVRGQTADKQHWQLISSSVKYFIDLQQINLFNLSIVTLSSQTFPELVETRIRISSFLSLMLIGCDAKDWKNTIQAALNELIEKHLGQKIYLICLFHCGRWTHLSGIRFHTHSCGRNCGWGFPLPSVGEKN